MCSCRAGLAERHWWLMAEGMPRHPWPKGLRPSPPLPSADKSQPSKAPDTQERQRLERLPRRIPWSSNSLLLVAVTVGKSGRLEEGWWWRWRSWDFGACRVRLPRSRQSQDPVTWQSLRPPAAIHGNRLKTSFRQLPPKMRSPQIEKFKSGF